MLAKGGSFADQAAGSQGNAGFGQELEQESSIERILRAFKRGVFGVLYVVSTAVSLAKGIVVIERLRELDGQGCFSQQIMGYIHDVC